ncbi:glycoside hydrolase family 5 protein [Gynuella sunshinyii]|uniref:cellulase n=1 Tax=Gynuella sunshinyii YC6258 TaxID=1445510 RepID=A0A0C5VN79_9GAMM|nr:cellulase family glycosylhydrolase [Gynuella sunshinyii]AJQ94803.1 endoglucanase [Gynuella sunshinyii YC6258]
MGITFKKIGLSTSIAMISLALSACDINIDRGTNSSSGSDGGSNSGPVTDTGNTNGGNTGDGSGSDNGGSDNGGSDNGGSNNGGSDNGGSDNGGSDNGGSDNGGSDNGGSDNGGSDNGGSDNGGSDNGGSDNGGSDNGGSDNGGSDNGGSDNGGSDNGGSDNGGSDNGGSDNGGSDNGGSDNGGSDNGGSDNGGSDNGGSDNGGSNGDKDPNDTISGEYASEWEDSYPVVTPVNNSTSLPGKFRVDQNGNITEDGQVMPLRCGNWFGLEGQQEPKNGDNNADGAAMELYLGNMWWFNGSQGSGRSLDSDMQEIKAMGINMVRLPVSPETLDPTDPQGMGDASQKNGGALKNHPSIQQENSLDGLQEFLVTADKYDIKVLLDMHSCSSYVGWRAGRIDAAPPWTDADRIGYEFTREDWSCNSADQGKQVTLKDGRTVTMNVRAYDENKWLADLQKLAQLPAELNIDNVIGIDIFNEPWDYTWSEWSTLAEKAYGAVNSVNNDLLVFVEGIGTKSEFGPSEEFRPNWGESLYGFASDPLNIPKDRLVLAPHTYGPSVYVQSHFLDSAQSECEGLEGDEAAAKDCNIVIDSNKLRKSWHQHFGFLRDQGYAVVVGEFGGNMDWPMSKSSQAVKDQWSHIKTDVDAQWQHKFVNYMMDNNIHACYWSINPESADTYGWIKTKYDPITAKDQWGTWGDGSGGSIFDDRKTELLYKFWQYNK